MGTDKITSAYLNKHLEILEPNTDVCQYLYSHKEQIDFAGAPKYWFSNSPVKSFYDNTLSIALPLFEDYMIDAMKSFLPKINDSNLRQQVEIFCDQEKNHAELHEKFNSVLKQQGIPVESFIAITNKILDKYRNIPIEQQLQISALCEGLTAVLSKYYIITSFNEKIYPPVHRLLIWHSIEEFEHRCVAYDVYLAANNNQHTPNYKLVLSFAFHLGINLFKKLFIQLYKDSLSNFFKLRTYRDMLWLFGPKGYVVAFTKGLYAFLQKDYNPKTYFDEAEMNEYIKHWEKKYHEGVSPDSLPKEPD